MVPQHDQASAWRGEVYDCDFNPTTRHAVGKILTSREFFFGTSIRTRSTIAKS